MTEDPRVKIEIMARLKQVAEESGIPYEELLAEAKKIPKRVPPAR